MRALLLGIPCVFAACSAPTPLPIASPLATKSDYLCESGQRLNVTFDPEDNTAAFSFEGRRLVLPAGTPQESAFLYGKDGTVLRGDELEVVLGRAGLPDLRCERPPAPSAVAGWSSAQRVDFICTDGTRLETRFDPSQETATVRWTGQSVTLAQEPVASGISYRSPQHWLRGKGEEVLWAVGRSAPLTCRTVGALGADADAYGQEPGWNAKLRGGVIEAAWDYGQARATAGPVSPSILPDGTRRYATPTLALTLAPKPCQDTMSGESFPMTATLEAGERKLSGCARTPAAGQAPNRPG